MAVHLFLVDGSHNTFKDIKNTNHKSSGIPMVHNLEWLYVRDSGVGYFTDPGSFKIIPIHRVKEIMITGLQDVD